MQFGVFSVSDITTDPTTGRTPSEAERVQAVVAIAKKAEEVGLDVFALGEHHNPPFFSSSPTVPRQAAGRSSVSGKLGISGSAKPRWTSLGRFQASASCGRTVLYSTR